MRQVIYTMMVSLDGFIEGPDPESDWAIVDEELHRFVNRQVDEMDAFLYGRLVYEVMAGYWPTAHLNPAVPEWEVEYAHIWQQKPKIVFSRTLSAVDANTRVISDNIPEAVRQLQVEGDNPLGLSGAEIAATLRQHGLIDEYHVFVQPVLLGGGKPMFPAQANQLDLRLIETRQFGSGVVFLRYENRAKNKS
jgi:dihydrofolate reductase